jgi:hypothetical protein
MFKFTSNLQPSNAASVKNLSNLNMPSKFILLGSTWIQKSDSSATTAEKNQKENGI